ncbi:WD40-repeat-containing domain protein [Scenedesmus sp. NREL 46B-D3]|nr:WD40-repeat-containing domain protein [Scenedesmus sp. NREL 46B-D3]
MEKATLQHSTSGKLVTGGHEKLMRLFDVERPEAAPVELTGAPSAIKAAVFVGPSDSLLVSSTGDTAGLTVWDVRGGAVVRSMPTDGPVTSVDLTHDGRWLTTTDNRNTIRVWDTLKLDAPAKVFTVSYPAEAASYCPSKNRFVAGGEDMWVHLHSADGAGAELEVNKGHHGPVHTVRFGPEGKEYASGSEDGTIRIWQTDWLESQAGLADGAAQVAVNAVAPPYANGAKA